MALAQRLDTQPEIGEFLRDVLEGLSGQQKTLPCKYLYDETGSRLFEQICELDDYYLTRTEATILEENLGEMATCIGPEALIVEPGAGNCEKIQPLLEELESPSGYMPIDISPEILLAARDAIKERLPQIQVHATVGDFTQHSAWRALENNGGDKRVIFFPGSTIGNFNPEQARALLRNFSSHLEAGDGLLIGTDLVKDSVILERAYCDSKHITEAFNKNLLVRINGELAGDFDTGLFAHRAFYHPLRQRVEMHLVSLKDQAVHIAGETIRFKEGETIHTENSHKYSLEDFHNLLAETGYTPQKHWRDGQRHYAIHYARVS
ncbi:L-histidine N(alpha)-methyltransferase [Microbulbifer sp.]|uniref:L-histidine N(alpha)-methyltransferase n=1 Tax=Microbulbifer sp. TaxID=1908541 RepID=UPI003F34B675